MYISYVNATLYDWYVPHEIHKYMFFLQMSSEEKNTQVCQKKQNQVFQYAYH